MVVTNGGNIGRTRKEKIKYRKIGAAKGVAEKTGPL